MLSPKFCLRTGVVGSVVVALCCFTPVLVALLGWLGLGAWLDWLDYILLPTLGIFLALAVYGYYAGQQLVQSAAGDNETPIE